MKIDQCFFNTVLFLLTVTFIGFLVKGGSVALASLLGMIGSTFFNLSIFLSSIFGLQYFQLGTGRDIQKEIFDESNIAAAIYQGLLFLGIAIIISKAF